MGGAGAVPGCIVVRKIARGDAPGHRRMFPKPRKPLEGKRIPMLDREEYVEQAHFFRTLEQRLLQNIPMQELLVSLREEILVTTKLPMAIDFMLGELIHAGGVSTAMARLGHYFTSFQTYVLTEAEDDRGRFDMRTGLRILAREARYRTESPTPQGIFLYQFETLCRNRLRYAQGLSAMAEDPIYDRAWRDWIAAARNQIGVVDFADMIYFSSQHYVNQRRRRLAAGTENRVEDCPVLFGEREGKIALANRHKEPLLLFSALQRQLGYPAVPRPKPVDETIELIPQLLRRLERIETRLKLMEEEQKDGIDITRFFQSQSEDSFHPSEHSE